MKNEKSLIYGPVASRRLGMSLGIDVVPYKICSFDCIYCQIGRTRETTVKRSPFGLSDAIFKALAEKLEGGIRADHITLGGSGEPTLNMETGDIIRGIKKMTAIPVAVLTNGSMLWDQQVRKDLQAADIVLPSLDAADAETFAAINRPHPDISFSRLVDGLVSFSKDFPGEIWLEIFLVKSMNTSDVHIDQFKAMVDRIKPDRVHLNTSVRPPAEPFAMAVDRKTLEAIALKIGGNAEVIAEFKDHQEKVAERSLHEQDLLDMLLRRPCTISDMAGALNADEGRVAGLVEKLVAEGRVTSRASGTTIYYLGRENPEASV